jgi:hypothetical protein
MPRFEEIFGELRAGCAIEDASERLEECIQSVRQTGKPATMTITLTLKPAGNGRVFVQDKCEAKRPLPVHEDTLFFLTEGGELTRRDPRQMTLSELR